MKCQKSATTPEMRVADRFDSSLAMRNGDRALRPRSERSSAIDATVDVNRNYTLRRPGDEPSPVSLLAESPEKNVRVQQYAHQRPSKPAMDLAKCSPLAEPSP